MSQPQEVDRSIRLVAELSIDKASQVFSKMIKGGAKIQLRQVSWMDITDATRNIGEKNSEAIGAAIDLVGDAPFKFLFYVGTAEAFALTDCMLMQPPGTTKELSPLVTSAVQEIGNILASAVTNVFSTDFRLTMRPAPPVVLCEYASTLFEQLIFSSAEKMDRLLLMETIFNVVKSDMECHMYMIPISGSEEILKFAAGG